MNTYENVKQEKKILEINSLKMCETRWKGAGSNTSDTDKIIHSGGEKLQRDVAIVLDLQR